MAEAEQTTSAAETSQPKPVAEPSSSNTNNHNLVLLAVDSSEQALHAFNYYMDWLAKPTDEILMLHCPEYSEWNYRILKGQDDPFVDWLGLWDEDLEKVKVLQDKFENLLETHNLKGTFEVEPSATPGETIVKKAEDRQVSYVVMGTRGVGIVRRTILGSVSDYVLHHCHRPVCIYRQYDTPETY